MAQQDWRDEQQTWETEEDSGDRIAVVGMAGRFPGAGNCDELWRNLRDGIEGVRFFSEEELLQNGISKEQVQHRHYVKAAPMLDEVAAFDAGFFGYTPREAELLDPQQRLFLEVVWEALENAGFRDGEHNNTTGLFAGSGLSHYLMNHLQDRFTYDEAGFETLIGNDKDYLCTRVAYKLNLGGPAINIQTACSSSLVAVHAACQSLISHECDTAVAGGVTIRLPGVAGYQYQEGGLFSPDGHCRPFDADARGTLFGSGVGAVVLKRLNDALADGDPIRAVVLASAVNNDGARKVGYTAPSEIGQLRVLAETLELAGIEPDTVGYIEAHGTGTALGDPIEAAALKQAYPKKGDHHRCALGSLKSNIGHLENAAGIAGFIKTVLVLEHGQIPATLHFKKLNPMIQFEESPFFVADHLQPWPMRGTRRAGVSSFGIGGTNAHILLEQAPPKPQTPPARESDTPVLLPLSARGERSLHDLAAAYHDLLVQSETPIPLQALAYNAALRRNHHHHRLTVRAKDRRGAGDALKAFQQGRSHPALAHGQAQRDASHRVVFVFPGQGSQWPGMATDLARDYPVFRAALEQCDRLIRQYRDEPLLATLNSPAAEAALGRVDFVQPALFAVSYALAKLWQSFGVNPEAVIGHSQGEITAACVAGCLSLDDAVHIVCVRSRLVANLAGDGRMAVVEIDAETCREQLALLGDHVSLAAVNSPRSCVVAGRGDAVRELLARWEGEGRYVRLVDVTYASHSIQVERVLTPLGDQLAGIQPRIGDIPLYSSLSAERVDGEELDAGYWCRNLREPVRFYDAVALCYRDQFTHFIEISPHPILQHALRDSLQACHQAFPIQAPAAVAATLKREQNGRDSFLDQLAVVYTQGLDLPWERLFSERYPAMQLPAYPWHHRRYWIEATAAEQAAGAVATDGIQHDHALLKGSIRLAGGDDHRLWQTRISLENPSFLNDHGVAGMAIVPAALMMELVREVGAQMFDGATPVISELTFGQPFFLNGEQSYLLQLRAERREPHQVAVSLSSSPRDENRWVEHATGWVEAERALGTPDAPAAVSGLAGPRTRCRKSLDVEAFYTQQEQHGLFYGPSFRGIRSLQVGENEALAHLQLPAECDSDSGYGIHPALLDACLQTLLACRPPQDAGDTLYLPYALHHFQMDVRPRDDLWVHARMEPGDGPEREVVGHLHGYDEDGSPLFRLDHLRFRATAFDNEQASPKFNLHWTPVEPLLHGDTAGGDGSWLLFADASGEAERLAQALANHGQNSYLVTRGSAFAMQAERATVNPEEPADFERLQQALSSRKWRGMVYLWALDGPDLLSRHPDRLHEALALSGRYLLTLTQSLLTHGERHHFPLLPLTLITQGAHADRGHDAPCTGCPAQAPLWSMAAVLHQEHPVFQPRCIDLAPAPPRVEGEDRRSRDHEHEQLVFELLLPDGENRIKYRHNQRLAQRLVQHEPPRPEDVPRTTCNPRQDRLVVEALNPGDLASVRPVKHEPLHASGDQVLVAVEAAGLNFLDLLSAMGQRPDQPEDGIRLGAECAGRVLAVGPGVTEFQVGQAVFALANPAFSSQVLVPQTFVRPIPEPLDVVQAATMLIAPLTATVALRHIAHLGAQDHILIHSAASGTGLAAFQLARALGATVYATAGTPEKRRYLSEQGAAAVADSRSTDFASMFREATGGRGVDVVLNALPGEAMRLSLELLAPYGRFVEIGKRDIYENQGLGLLPFQRNLSYTALDLARMMVERPTVISKNLDQVCTDIRDGVFRAQPTQIYPLSRADEALGALGQARHVGKLALTVGKEPVAAIPPKPRITIHGDGAYLITGGTGGLGWVFAKYLADQGARRLILWSRRCNISDSAARELADRGVKLEIRAVDVGDDHQVSENMTQIQQSGFPLRGIIHAAGIVEDIPWRDTSTDSFTRVTAAKAAGAWHLHQATKGHDLDFTLYFSSTAAFNGTPGQAGYAAANGFLDALATLRRGLGHTTISINWGGWTEVGLAAEQLRGAAARFGISPEEGTAVFASLMSEPMTTQLVVTKTPIPPWLPSTHATPALFCLLDQPGRGKRKQREDLVAQLDAASGEKRLIILEHYLIEQLSDVLRFPAGQIATDVGLNEYGLSSLFALELRNRIEHDLAMSIPVVWFFQAGTIHGLAERIQEARTLATLVETEESAQPDEDQDEDWDELTL
ncbi:Type I polyketide synthase [Acanthopleuribacter pedis]